MRWPIVIHIPHKYIRWQESKHHQKCFFRWAQYSTYFFKFLAFLSWTRQCMTRNFQRYLVIFPNAVDFHLFIYNLWTFGGFLFYDFSSKLSRLLREEFAAKNLQVSLLGRKGESELRSRRCSPPADQPPWIEFSGGAPQIRLICLLWKVFLYLHASCHNKVSQSGLYMCGQAYKSAKSYRQFF